jgi:hypothetical protein
MTQFLLGSKKSVLTGVYLFHYKVAFNLARFYSCP